MDLDRKSTTEHLVAYITTHHESLVALLPPDTTCADLFGEVENQRPIASFFSASQDAAIGRQLLRFTQMIGLWLVDEKKKTKALQQRDKRDAQETARKSILKAKRPKLDPPIVPFMAFEDAQLVAEHAQNKRDESMREALLQKGYTASLRVANPHIAPEHIKYFALPRPFASVIRTIYGRWPSGVRGYALSGDLQTVHSVWGYACRAFWLPNHTLTPTYSKSGANAYRDRCGTHDAWVLLTDASPISFLFSASFLSQSATHDDDGLNLPFRSRALTLASCE